MGLNGLGPGVGKMTLLFANSDPREIDWHFLEEATAAYEADRWALVLSLLTTQVHATGV